MIRGNLTASRLRSRETVKFNQASAEPCRKSEGKVSAMKKYSTAKYSPWLLLTIALAIILLGAVVVRTAFGDDIWSGPDSDLIAEIPIQDATTTAANEATVTVMETAEAELMAAAALTPVTKPEKFETPTIIPPTIDLTTASIRTHGALPSGWGSLYKITNNWNGPVNGHRVTVYAGSVVDDRLAAVWNDPQQGVLIIMTWADPGIEAGPTTAQYLTPTHVGAAQITDFDGTCLTVTAGQSTYVFDVATETWSCGVGSEPPP